jgi:hypothetical protein
MQLARNAEQALQKLFDVVAQVEQKETMTWPNHQMLVPR